MSCLKFSFIAILIVGFNLKESRCLEWSKFIVEHDQHLEHLHENQGEEARVQSTETNPVEGSENDDFLLVPRVACGLFKNCWKRRKSGRRKAPVITESKYMKPKPPSRHIWFKRKVTPPWKNVSTRQKSVDPTAFLRCMLDAAKTWLTPVVEGLASGSGEHFFGKVDGILEGQPAIATDPRIAKSFAETAQPCFDLLGHDENGKLTLGKDFATNPTAEALKLHPMGTLTLRATEAVAENVRVTYDRGEKPQYKINYRGLATGLGMAVVKSTIVGQILIQSMEDRRRRTKNDSQTIKGSNATSMPRNQAAPTNLIDLLGCAVNAAVSTISIAAIVDQVIGSFRDQLGHSPRSGGKSGGRSKGTTQTVGNPANAVTPNVLGSFVKAATPCFRLFLRNENGRLIWDREFAARAVDETMKLNPAVGTLALRSTQAVAENVRATQGKEGRLKYCINSKGLVAGLKTAIIQAAKLSESRDLMKN